MILGNCSIITMDGATFIRVDVLRLLLDKIKVKHGLVMSESVDDMIDETVDELKEELNKEAKKHYYEW